MKDLTVLLFTGLLLTTCNNQTGSSSVSEPEEAFVSKKESGKWTTDFATAQELKGMRNTIENFTLLNKKKFENLKAYQEFGDLMQMHVERVNTLCRLDPDTKNLLCKKLDSIKEEVTVLHGEDMVKSKEAVEHINTYLADIDSTFSYMN